MTVSTHVPRAMLVARITLFLAGILYMLGGLFLYRFVSPSKMDDGMYWDGIDPISIERARELSREALKVLLVGMAGGALHWIAAFVAGKAPWSRWLILGMGVFYGVAAAFLSVKVASDPSSGLPVYAAVAMLLGLVLLNASRHRAHHPQAPS